MGMWEIMKDHGATRIIEAWQDDVPKGKQTDFFRATKAESGEAVVFSFVEWSSREACDGSHEKMMQDARMKQFMEENPEIGRAHVCTQVTNTHTVCRLLIEQ